MADDYYQILGVSRSASESEIQKAYRRLARKHHPDLAEDKKRAKEKFQKIQQAYDVLSDPEKRKLYDQLGPNFESYAQASRGGQGPGGGGRGAGGFDFRDVFGQGGGDGPPLEEILRQFGFRGGGGGRRSAPFEFDTGPMPTEEPPPRPADRREEITISFQTAVAGGKHQIQLVRPDGRTQAISLTIPAGIEDGKTMRLRGQGDARPGGANGDLIVRIRVAPHPVFTRHAKNLHVVVPITVAEAVSGGKIELPTPHGEVTLTIPPFSSSGRQMRLKGMGIRPANQSPGDLIAELQIVLPETRDDSQAEALEQLAERLGTYAPRARLRW
jgi:DnaJ-class molecular chaperone